MACPTNAFPSHGETQALARVRPAHDRFTPVLVRTVNNATIRLSVRIATPLTDRHVPRAPLPGLGVTLPGVMSRITSTGVTPSSSLRRAHAPVQLPPAAYGLASVGRSLQVAASPGCKLDLPDVISADLFPRAWTSTPAAPKVLLPVTSLGTSAFSQIGRDRRSTMSGHPLPSGGSFRGCSHSLMFRPAGLLAILADPTRCNAPSSDGFYVRASLRSSPP